jgi:hypothetical protein
MSAPTGEAPTYTEQLTYATEAIEHVEGLITANENSMAHLRNANVGDKTLEPLGTCSEHLKAAVTAYRSFQDGLLTHAPVQDAITSVGVDEVADKEFYTGG